MKSEDGRIDMTKVIAWNESRPVPTMQQLERMIQMNVRPSIVRRDDGTQLYMGAVDQAGNNVDNDCQPL